MAERKTNDEFIRELNNLGTEITALDLYINAVTKINFQCKNGHVWTAKPTNILSGYGCPYCAGRYKTKDALQQELDAMGRNIVVIGEYIDAKTKIQFRCGVGHVFDRSPGEVLAGGGCPYCSNKRVLVGFNDLWTTHPHIAQMLKDQEDGFKYTYGSGKKVDFVCPDCGAIHTKDIHTVCQRGFVCHKCSDGVSYPNKFARSLLSLLPVENIKYEWQPDWAKPYFYDNYFEYNHQMYVLEMDGGLGHGKRSLGSNSKDVDGLYNDQVKDVLAYKHNITIIRIDCDYPPDNRFEYIKDSILHSHLKDLFDLSNIDWDWCNAQGVRKMVKEVANLYNQGLAVKTICQQIGYSMSGVLRWLRQAKCIGLCNYNKKESNIRGGRTITKHNIAVNQYTLDGCYVDTYESMEKAKRILGLTGSRISWCCSHPNHSTGGYKWYKAYDPNQPDKTKILNCEVQQNE